MKTSLASLCSHLALAGMVLFGPGGASAALISVYTLDSDFSDSLGNNPDLVEYNTSSSTFSGGAWSWTAPGNPGGGVIMDLDASLANVYTFGMRMKWDSLPGGYVKLIDYKDQASDNGVYFYQGGMTFYPSGDTGGNVAANTFFDILITRDGSNQVNVYVDGNPTPLITYSDSGDDAVPVLVGGKARFRLFHDDTAVTDHEWSTGTIDEIRIWDTVLTPSEVVIAFQAGAAMASASASGLQTASAQDQSLLGSMQNALSDINGRLFNLRAGGGEEGGDGGIASLIDDGVFVGQGDGPGDGPVARKMLRSRQWEVYTTVNYANISLSSIGNQAGVNSQTWAPSVGIERHLDPNWTVGFALTLLETHQGYNNSLGTLDIEGPALSTYLSYVRKGFWIDGLYSFGRLDLDSERNPGFGFPVANGGTTAYTNAVQFNSGYNFRFQNNTLVTGPFVGLDYLHVAVDGYTETGGGLAALTFGDRNFDSLVSRVGWSASKRCSTDFAIITPQLRLSYERQNINNNGTSVNLVNVPFQATTNGQAPGQDYMVAGAGVNFEFSEAFSLLLNYQTQIFRQDMQAHYASVRFSYRF